MQRRTTAIFPHVPIEMVGELGVAATSDSVPMRIDDAGCLTDFRGDNLDLLFGQSTDIHLDVDGIVDAELSDDSARQKV